MIASLGPAMHGVANASGKVDKATQQAGKATEQLGKAADRTTKGLVGVERTVARQTIKNSILRGEIIKLADAQVQLEKAFTPSQAGMLASLKIAGATADQYRRMATEFKEYNQTVGANKFDDSTNGLTKLTKEVEELSLVQKLAAEGYQLTAKEIRDLSRDEAALRQSLEKNQIGQKEYQEKLAFTRQEYIRLSAEKASYIQQSKLAEDQIKREAQAQARSASMMGEDAVRLFREKQAAAKQAAQVQQEADKKVQDSSDRLFRNRISYINEEIKAVDANRNAWREYYQSQGVIETPGRKVKSVAQPMDAATNLFYKEQEKQAKDAAKAQQWLTSEMQRTDAVMSEMNNQFGLNAATGERSAAAVAKYANALERAGITGVEAASRLETYRNKVQQIAMQDEKRAATRLSRALTPQISDVAVSLAGGMPLHLVIMQQGLQIRDLIAQSGVAAGTLQQVFKTAAADMVKSIGGTVAALGSLTFGALVDAGKAVANFSVGLTGQKDRLNYFTWQLQQGAAAGSLMDKSLLALTRGGVVAIGIGLGATVVAMGALIYETVKLIGANNDLARSLATTGGSFNLAYGSSQGYVDGLVAVGASTRDALQIINEMSKSSKLTSKDIQLVGESAVDMQRYAGVAIEDTVKSFNKMADGPSKALIELAKRTGDVAPEVLKLVIELEKQGKTANAASIAIQELANHNEKAVNRMKKDLYPLTVMWNDFAAAISKGWGSLVNSINRGIGNQPELQKLQEQIAEIQKVRSGDLGAVFTSSKDPSFYTEENLRMLQSRVGALIRIQGEEGRLQQIQAKAGAEEEKRQAALNQYATKAEQRSKALAELEANKSRISAEAYKESKKRIEEQFKDKSVGAEVNKQATYQVGIVEKLNDSFVKMTKSSQSYNEIQTALLDIFDDPRFAKMSDDQKIALREQAESLLALSVAEKEAKEAEEAANKVREKSVELRNQQVEAANKLILATQQSITGIDSQIKDVDFNASVFGLSPELERKLRSEYELKKKYETAGLEFYKEVETAKSTTSGEMLQEQLQQLGVKYQRSVELAQKQAELENKTLTDQQKRIQGFDAVFKQGFESMADKMIEFAATGEASFGDMIQSMLMELAKLELKMQMMKMYESMGGGSESGILGTLFGMFTGTTQAKGGAWNNGVQMFAKGGVVNRTTAFGMQGGMGVMGEAGPEAIMPLKRGRDGSLGVSGGSGTNVQVFVNNYSQAQVQQKETVDSRGNRRVEVTVGDMTAGEIQRNGSSAQRSIGSTFGMQPVLKNR